MNISFNLLKVTQRTPPCVLYTQLLMSNTVEGTPSLHIQSLRIAQGSGKSFKKEYKDIDKMQKGVVNYYFDSATMKAECHIHVAVFLVEHILPLLTADHLTHLCPPRPWGERGHLDLLWFPVTQM